MGKEPTTLAPVLVCPLPSHGMDGGGCAWLAEWAAVLGWYRVVVEPR